MLRPRRQGDAALPVETFKPGMPADIPEAARGGVNGENSVTIGQPTRDILNSAPEARPAAGTTPPAGGGAAADKSAASNGAATTTTSPAAAKSEAGPGEGSIAVTSENARAAAMKKAKAAPKPGRSEASRQAVRSQEYRAGPGCHHAASARYDSGPTGRQDFGRRRPSSPTMSRILLVDDSPHAQRMGERILSEEGYEVVTVSNADSALIRMEDVDPDVVLADTVMPGRTGFEICQYLKMSPRHRCMRVILTAGVLEAFDEERARQVSADGTLKKPFEASALVSAVKPLAEAAAEDQHAQAARVVQPHPLHRKPRAKSHSLPWWIRTCTRCCHGGARRVARGRRSARSRAACWRPCGRGNAEARQFEQKGHESGIPELRLPLPKISEPLPSQPLLAPAASRAAKVPAPHPRRQPAPAEPIRRVTPMRIRSGLHLRPWTPAERTARARSRINYTDI